MAHPFAYVARTVKRDTVRDVKGMFTQPEYDDDTMTYGDDWEVVRPQLDDPGPFIPGHPHPFRDAWSVVKRASKRAGGKVSTSLNDNDVSKGEASGGGL